MKRVTRFLALVGLLALAACATPPEVKQLSTAQIGYFDTALGAVARQSEALIIATEKIQKQAEARLAEQEKQNNDELANLLVNQSTGGDEAARRRIVSQALGEAGLNRQALEDGKARLAANVAAIKAKSQELQGYLKKMKDVQITLDAYIQSEKAGEGVLNDVVNQPSVSRLLGTVSDLIPKVSGAADDIMTLLSGLRV